MISGVRKIIIPVENEESAREFWTSRLGFDVTLDERYGEGRRWIEVTPPDRSLVLVLSQRHPDDPDGRCRRNSHTRPCSSCATTSRPLIMS